VVAVKGKILRGWRVDISEYRIKHGWPGKDPQLLRVNMSGKENSERLKRKTPAKASF